jgi:hypothetical protein
MVEAASTYETSVYFYQTTRRNNPEDSHIQDYFSLNPDHISYLKVYAYHFLENMVFETARTRVCVCVTNLTWHECSLSILPDIHVTQRFRTVKKHESSTSSHETAIETS